MWAYLTTAIVAFILAVTVFNMNREPEMLPVIRIAAPLKATASMIIIHGLGDSGSGWTFMADEFHKHEEFKHINFIFPNAPTGPLYVNGNQPIARWFNIFEFGNPYAQQDEEGYWSSCKKMENLINQEVKNGIPSERVIVGGFSQGAVLSLGLAISYNKKLAGILNMSGIFAMKKGIPSRIKTVNFDTPIFHGHGDIDPVFNIVFARQTAEYFKALGFKDYQFHEYIGMVHQTCSDEMNDIENFVRKALPPQ